ncbi:AAA-type ATPase family protein / ankyrin repeat family protein [Striga hermonthica]|uniref:AAA-type ATPase family protein / ankyrin repeat family protein n=1 Tax=Striga hermonthica TaxID=68872 RepID=A0A9N7RGR7_STRHE|nr:AAA-type ATPase family protein / ankyrin repeat family protein [Striga hermonthica]
MRIQDKNLKNKSHVSIHACTEAGDLIGVQRLLSQNPSLLNERGIVTVQTPLHVASGHNKFEIVKYLLDWRGPGKVELEAKNVYGETPLHLAAKNGCNEALRMLLQGGANVEARTNNMMTPLHLAVGYALRTGDNSTVRTLVLEYNADCSAKDDNYDNGIQGKLEEFDNELSQIVGLKPLKEQLRKWAKGMLLDERRRAMGINLGPRKAPHMAFLGNPGTGKTTVARILGKLMNSVGVLSSDKVTEVQRTDLVAEYLGQTGAKTRKKIEEAMGGILFVDEAYRLVPQQGAGHSQDYGVEALEEIMSVLEDGEIVVVFAGYTEPMRRVFSSNEGFCRRVTHFFDFDDYSSWELAEMLMIKMRKADEKSRLFGFRLHPSCTLDAVVAVIERCSTEKLRNKLNGGLVDHMLNNARECLDARLNLSSTGDELLTITLGDLENGLRHLAERVMVN